jgi:hypothetical protein
MMGDCIPDCVMSTSIFKVEPSSFYSLECSKSEHIGIIGTIPSYQKRKRKNNRPKYSCKLPNRRTMHILNFECTKKISRRFFLFLT